MRKAHASWDLLKLVPHDTREIIERAAARVEPLKHLLADSDTARAVAIALAERYRDWAQRPRIIQSPPGTEPFISIPFIVIGGLLTAISLTSLLSGVSRREQGYVLSVIASGLTLTVMGVLTFRRNRRFHRPFRNFQKCRCPDCGYDLAGSPAAPPPFDAATIGSSIGPEYCPECGALWPLVPPAI